MILSNGMIKITDFGVATALNSTQLTQTNSVMGTVHYLPPEQAQGKGSTIRSDIYSMGIMMYELLTGLVPYKGENAVEIALKHLKEPLPSVRKINANIPQSIENVIIRATAKNPKNRYVDAREMHEDLKTALDESRKDEPRYVYKYPENDLDETKKLDKELKALEEKTKEKKEEVNVEEPVKKRKTKEIEDDDFYDDEPRKSNVFLIVLVSIFTLVVLVATIFATMYFGNSEVENIEIPDVSNMTTVEASNKLTDAGFNVVDDYKYVPTDEYPEGKVVKTSPEAGMKKKAGSEITLHVSSGEAVYIVEDVVGEDYKVAQGKIEGKCNCNVIFETEVIPEKDKKAKEGKVLKTVPAAGEKVKLGEQITIIIPEIEYKYPDFTKDWSMVKIEDFCEKHELKLSVKYEETDKYKEGTVIKQSREKDTVVTPGASLTITVAKAPETEETIDVNPDDPDVTPEDTTTED
jgi:serine/threonine-protein kinase